MIEPLCLKLSLNLRLYFTDLEHRESIVFPSTQRILIDAVIDKVDERSADHT